METKNKNRNSTKRICKHHHLREHLPGITQHDISNVRTLSFSSTHTYTSSQQTQFNILRYAFQCVFYVSLLSTSLICFYFPFNFHPSACSMLMSYVWHSNKQTFNIERNVHCTHRKNKRQHFDLNIVHFFPFIMMFVGLSALKKAKEND